MLEKNMIEILEKNAVIDTDKREIYEFGFKQLNSILFDTLITIAIGFLMKKPLEMLIFIVSFSIIRRYAGGYHASKRILCIIYSIIVQILSINVISNYVSDFYILTILSIIGICVLSPIDTENHRLDEKEIKFYKKRTILFTSIIALFIVITFFFKLEIYYKSISVALICIFISLIVGWLNNFLLENKSV